MTEFKELGLSDESIKALEKKGFTTPTDIQTKVIPLLLKGEKDIVGQSQTGTGKTASFALPILEKIEANSKTVQAIVLVPTRELALQVAQEIDSLKGDKKIKILSVYGGAPIGPQREKLRNGVDIIVGTPGRVMDLQRRKSLRINDIKYAILDEADEMLNMGFVEDIKEILKNTPKDKKVLLFSATMPQPILKIAEKYMHDYVFLEVEKVDIITKTVEQIYYILNSKDKIEGIRRIIDYYPDFHGIIFCNTKMGVDNLNNQLTKMGYGVAALHGDIAQNQREKILLQFKKRYVNVLVATDVAARGIDVNDLTHVINYSLPQSPQLYVHRIGRTGRAGKKGISITFVLPSEKGRLRFFERSNKCRIKERTLPSVKEIIEHKENQISTVIKTIIEGTTGKSSKYTEMAKELLKEHKPEDVVSAILKYSFKNELDSNNYKDLSKLDYAEEDTESGNFRRNRGRSRQGRESGRSDFRGRGRDRRPSRDSSNRDRKPKKSYSKDKKG